jgi:outer membrane autotransporter protein
MRRILHLVCLLGLLLPLAGIVAAADLAPTYSESAQLAIDHAANPAGWTAPSLFSITGPGGAQGLTYDAGALIVRTASKSRNFKWNYVGQAGYKIYGPATTDAAWVTTGNDATQFLLANGVTGANATKLLERGLGMDATGTHDAVVEFALVPTNDNLMRPVRNPDITQYLPAQYGDSFPFVKPAGMTDATYANFKAYYENWKASAYGQYPFPWTQLGYTFFWGNGTSLANIQGMTEFIILGQTPVEIYGIYATGSYIYTRNKGGAFSTDSDAQYGNGFASFKVDGTCDTVWAGHRFQKNVRTATAAPNEIRIESGGSISGGQGILVWSLNYDLINNGTISGATADKFGIGGTSNVAVLFKGDTSADYGTPITTAGAVNRLTNAGTISSPGTAVKAEAGNTEITNNAGGVISGGAYAVQTGAGNDTLTVNGGQITGSIDLGAGTDTVDVTGAGAAKLTFTLNRDTAASAQIANAETVTIADNTTLAVQVGGTRNIRNNDRFLIVDAATLTVNPENLTIQNDSAVPMVTFSAEKAGTQLSLVAARNGTYYGRNSGNASLGALLDSLANTATGDMATVLGALDSSGDAGNARKFEPTVNGGVLQAGYGAAGQFTQAVISRIDQVLATRSGMTGVSAGDEPAREGVWAQGFGAYLRQGARGASDGYTADLWGGAFGYDRFVYDHLLMGFGGGYAHNRIRALGSGSRTNADGYQGHLYGNLSRGLYTIDAILSFGQNLYDASRPVRFGTIDRVAKSDYAGQQVSGYLEGGYTLKGSGLALTPLVSLQYQRLHLNGYTETGADALNLTVEGQNYNLFQTGLGAKLAYPIPTGGGQLIPEVHAKWLYDFIGDPQETTAQFAGGGAAFATRGLDPAQSSYNAGAKLTWLTKSNVTVSVSYDFGVKEGFSSHSGHLHVRYAF